MNFRRRIDQRTGDPLEQDLYSLGRELGRMPTPDVAVQVRQRLLEQPPAPSRRQAWVFLRSPWRMAAALAILVVVLGASLALVPTTREALARFFGLEHIRIVRDDTLDGTPGPEGRTLVGATTLEQARRQMDFPVLLPRLKGLAEPDEVYVQQLGSPQELQVVLRYYWRPGFPDGIPGKKDILFTLYQFRTTGVFEKFITSEIRLQEVSVKGVSGFWLEGAFHLLRYRTADGHEVADLSRQVQGNTLAWEVDGVTYRLETELSLEEALKIAESME